MSTFTLRSMAVRQASLRSAMPARSFRAFQARRTYANDPSSEGSSTRGTPGATTNIRDSPSADPQSKDINASRGAEHGSSGSPDTKSTQNPISNPSEHAVGATEEEPSQDSMKSDPSEPDHVKREKVEKEGQKPLDPADK